MASVISQRWFSLALGLLLVLGSAMRFHNLGKRSLWTDELFTMAVAMYHPLVPSEGQPWYRPTSVLQIADDDTFLTVKAGEQSPPLHDLLVKASVHTLGPTEFAVRLPGALASCVLLAWIAWLAWRARDSWVRRVLGWSLLFLALYPSLVVYAKDGRAYSLGASLAGMAGVLWLLRWRHGWRQWESPGWGEILLFTLACYTHYNTAALVALLLLADAVMATATGSGKAWGRLLTLGMVFLTWVAINARTIVFTASGGIAWRERKGWDFVVSALHDAPNAMHPGWLVLGLALALVVPRLWRQKRATLPPRAIACCVLAGIVVAYVVIAGWIAFKAGMAHPRYFLFCVPLVAVVLGMVLAELRGRWLVTGGVLMVVLLSKAPPLPGTSLTAREEFREMTQFAVEGVERDSLFVYPWLPNRDLYRVYLDRLLGEDSRARMVATSSPEDRWRVCERLAGLRHVVVFGHVSGRMRIDEVYAACGTRWPYRDRRQFHMTFAEHWRTEPAPVAATR